MNACEAEILEITGYKPRKKYKDRQHYLICLVRAVVYLPDDKYEHLISQQVHEWHHRAVKAFKEYKDIPELPDVSVDDLRYLRDEENYVPPATQTATPEEHKENIKALLDAQAKADEALAVLKEASEKVRPKRHSKYRLPAPGEGARHYLFPELDRFGFIRGTERSKAAEMFERGAMMKEVKEKIGYPTYNMLRMLREKGHRIENADGLIRLTHKEDLAKSVES